MSKIVCDVCGTSYPETSTQCPICGCVRPVDSKSVSGDTGADNLGSREYKHVKGGRFSKKNVQKRTKGTSVPVRNTTANKMAKNNKEKDKTTGGLVVTAVLLILAIIAVVIYISLKYFAPDILKDPQILFPKVTASQNETPGQTDTPETQPKTIPCTGVSLDVTSIVLDKIDAARMVYATAKPADTTDSLSFISSNEEVAIVSSDGKITAVGPGEATITVQCGEFTATCAVSCTAVIEEETTEATTVPTEAEEVFTLNRSDITFSKKGESWLLYSGNIAKTQIQWSSDDESIATIEGGKVTAVGGGVTEVHGEYEGTKVSCIIRCGFESEPGVEGSGGVSEDDGQQGSSGGISEDSGDSSDSSTGYQLYNPYGSAEDVTIKVGDSFTLQLMDNSGQPVEPAWAVADTDCCSASGNTFTGVSAGTTSITATYEGAVYTCVVRVK